MPHPPRSPRSRLYRNALAFALTAAVVLLSLPLRTGFAARGPDFPEGFVDDLVIGGLQDPMAFSFLPDGRILIAERAGAVRLYKDGALQEQPFRRPPRPGGHHGHARHLRHGGFPRLCRKRPCLPLLRVSARCAGDPGQSHQFG